jgi:hypothetical protein
LTSFTTAGEEHSKRHRTSSSAGKSIEPRYVTLVPIREALSASWSAYSEETSSSFVVTLGQKHLAA